jgi:4-amino-4-deoxy-L-arabinose transferase-like glycosyltransferase
LRRAVEIEEQGAPLSRKRRPGRFAACGLAGPWWLAALFCVAGGLFTKWTAPAFFYLTALPWLYGRGRLRLLLGLPHLIGVGLVALVAAGWLVLAGQTAGWATLVDTLGREALLRLSPGHHPRPYPWDELVTFPLSLFLGCLPWSLVALVALHPVFRRVLDEKQRRLWSLCQCWLWANLLFWTLAPGHRPRHILPAQPAVAALAALVWFAWSTGRLRWPLPRLRPAALLVGLLAGWLAVKLVFVAAVLPARQTKRHPSAGAKMLAALVPPGRTLYLFRLKDDGLLFYYGRPARRLYGLGGLPAEAWCLLTEAEWQSWPVGVPAHAEGRLRDGQGAPLVLVRVWE